MSTPTTISDYYSISLRLPAWVFQLFSVGLASSHKRGLQPIHQCACHTVASPGKHRRGTRPQHGRRTGGLSGLFAAEPLGRYSRCRKAAAALPYPAWNSLASPCARFVYYAENAAVAMETCHLCVSFVTCISAPTSPIAIVP
jgi:hypothetical protein